MRPPEERVEMAYGERTGGKEKELGKGGETEKRQRGKKYGRRKKERGNVKKSFKKRRRGEKPQSRRCGGRSRHKGGVTRETFQIK